MAFGHERLDVYRAAIEYVGWAYGFCEELKGHRKAKALLDRIVAMLTKLGRRVYAVGEETGEYQTDRIDPDTDSDPDAEEDRGNESQPDASHGRGTAGAAPRQ